MATRTFTIQPGEADQPWVSVKIYEAATAAGPWNNTTLIDTQDLDPVDADPAAPAVRIITTFEAELDAGYYRIGFVDADDNEELTDPTVYPPLDVLFASVADVATRLGRALTDAETDQVELLLTIATSTITEAVGEDAEWASTLSPIPTAFRSVCIESVIRILLNPAGLKSGTETLGAYTRSGTYGVAGTFEMTRDEHRRIRRAVGLGTFAAVTLETPYSGDALDDEELELPL